MLKVVFTIFFTLSGFWGFAQQSIPNQVIETYNTTAKLTPREKVYLHTDKNSYLPPDTLWFKAYLVEASGLSYSKISQLIYIDIINMQGDIMQTHCIPTLQGLTWGNIPFDTKGYPPGGYTIRAYTNWMRNFDESCFFKKEIRILNYTNSAVQEPAKSFKLTTTVSSSIKTANAPQTDIQFLPEGGTWLAKRKQKMAFKAVAANGKSITVTGAVFDDDQRKVADFKSNTKGMGFFILSPEANKHYTVKINDNGRELKSTLPPTQSKGTAIQLDNHFGTDSLNVVVLSDLEEQPLTLIAQERGKVVIMANIVANTRIRRFTFAKNIFATGVCQILLMNDNGQVLNERSFFINHHDHLNVQINQSAKMYSSRDSIPVSVNVSDQSNQPVSGSFSVAITDDSQVFKDSTNDQNLLTYLLLSSDLKGNIEEPNYYFSENNEQRFNDLDLLMMTQGWVSYTWDLSKKPTFKAEQDFTISGKITNVMNTPVNNAKITLFGKNDGLILMDTLSNYRGEFVFKNFPPLDHARIVIQALNNKGRTGTLGIKLDEFTNPATARQTAILYDSNYLSDSIYSTSVKNQKKLSNPSSDGILLNEINITAKKIVKGSKNRNGNGNADFVINEEDLAKSPKKNLLQLLEQGVDRFHIGSFPKETLQDYFIKNAKVLLVIDSINVNEYFSPGWGVPNLTDHLNFTKFVLENYLAEDIKGVELMYSTKYTKAYEYDFTDPTTRFNFPYCFIEITTKTGKGLIFNKQANIVTYRPPNYGNNKTFYQPKYTSTNKNSAKPDLRSTIYWEPNLMTDEKGNANFSFFAADRKGTYTIWIEGTDTEGHFGFKTGTIIIK